MAYQMVCVQCGAKHDSRRYRLHCESCGGLLDTLYDTPATVEARVVVGAKGTARYLPTLPLNDPANLVTMGEGDTPVVSLPRVGQALGLSDVSAKMEYFNPTGSFKDRGNTIQVSVLKDTGVTEVADATGGNAMAERGRGQPYLRRPGVSRRTSGCQPHSADVTDRHMPR